MRTVLALLLTGALIALVSLQIAGQANYRRIPGLSVPSIVRRFRQYSARDTAALAAWYGAPLPDAVTAADVTSALRLSSDYVKDVAAVIVAIDLNTDGAVSALDAAYGAAAATMTWHAWSGDPSMWATPTAAAVRRLLRAAKVFEVAGAGVFIPPEAQYPLRLVLNLTADAVMATFEETVYSWWQFVDANHNGRLDMTELRTLPGAKWAAKLGITKAQALQHARAVAISAKKELAAWFLTSEEVSLAP